jgi:hypothetical protein
MNVESLPATVKTITLRLVPDPKVAEDQAGFEEIWGQPLEWQDIPLERFDLEGK